MNAVTEMVSGADGADVRTHDGNSEALLSEVSQDALADAAADPGDEDCSFHCATISAIASCSETRADGSTTCRSSV